MARTVKNLIVHHSLSHWGDGAVVKSWHTQPKPKGNGWKAPGYHAVICNGYPNYSLWSAKKPLASADGRVDRILAETEVSNGCKWANSNSVQVCLIGDLDKYPPTAKQVEKLVALVTFWCAKYGLDPAADIYGHGEMQKKLAKEKYSKTCPGTQVDMNAVRQAVEEKLGA